MPIPTTHSSTIRKLDSRVAEAPPVPHPDAAGSQTYLGMVPALASYRPKHIAGFAVAPVTSQALLHCTDSSEQASAEELDKDYLKLGSYHLTSGSGYHLVSNAAQSLVVGVDASLLSQKLCRLSCGQWTFNRLQRTLLEKELGSTKASSMPIAYCETFSWDETPLKAGVSGGSGDVTFAESNAFNEHTDDKEIKAIQRLGSGVRPDTLVCKVLQTQQWCGMVVKVGQVFGKLPFQQACPLQILQKTNATVLQEALVRQSGCTQSSKGFLFQGCVGSFDRAGYNSKAFTSLCALRSHANSMQLTCEVHDVSRAFVATFDGLITKQVTGLISCALSLRSAGMLAAFRLCLAEEISQRLVVLQGHPPPEAVAHRERILAVMTSGGAKNMPQMTVLVLLLNGDWRSHQIQHYTSTAEPVIDRASLVQKMVVGLSYALVGKKPPVWARHRWTGCEVAVEELGLMESVHQLLSTTYFRFLGKIGKTKATAASASAPLEQQPGQQDASSGR